MAKEMPCPGCQQPCEIPEQVILVIDTPGNWEAMHKPVVHVLTSNTTEIQGRFCWFQWTYARSGDSYFLSGDGAKEAHDAAQRS
jgi:hypothetical protein